MSRISDAQLQKRKKKSLGVKISNQLAALRSRGWNLVEDPPALQKDLFLKYLKGLLAHRDVVKTGDVQVELTLRESQVEDGVLKVNIDLTPAEMCAWLRG